MASTRVQRLEAGGEVAAQSILPRLHPLHPTMA
ncbi:uncharacterized protein G2W53_009620 [Senna tora]|uniref:Uncharacterized protein n=1 Tax=Senna tora TaxID=362788 RepID=A0A835C8A5_9FABA|nr:uncharacterized protein G2W53_009620 [Senna tora]